MPARRKETSLSNGKAGIKEGKNPANLNPLATDNDERLGLSVADVVSATQVRKHETVGKDLHGPYWGTLSTQDRLPSQHRSSNEMPKTTNVETDGGGNAPKDSLQSSHGRKSVLALPGQIPADGDGELERLSLGPRRDSTFVSLDSVSRRSVDYRISSNVAVPQVNSNDEDKPKSLIQADDALIRSAIPCLPLEMAILCFVINLVLPGMGTIISGFSILCCGKTRVPTKDDHVMVTLCVNVWVGVAQLFTIPLFLVGWFWSIAWGVKMVIFSIEDRKEQKKQRDKDLQQLALSAFGSPRMLPL